MRGPYVIQFDGDDAVHAPSSFGPLTDMRGQTIYNPDNLYADACKAAQRLAVEFETPATVIGKIGSATAASPKRSVQAARINVYREGDYVFVAQPHSFNYVRCPRPRS